MKWLFRKASKPPKAKLATSFRESHVGSKRLGFPRIRGLSKKPKGGSGKGPPNRKRKDSSEDDCTSEFQFQFFQLPRGEQELSLRRQDVGSENTDSGAVFDLSPTSGESAPPCTGTLCAGRCPTCHSVLLHRRREKPLPPAPTPLYVSANIRRSDSGVYDEIPGSPSACVLAGQAACRKRKRPATADCVVERKRPRASPPPLPPHRELLASMLQPPVFDDDSLERSATASEKIMWSFGEEAVYDVYDEYDSHPASNRTSDGSLEALLRAGDEVRRLRDMRETKRELPFTADELDQWLRREMDVFRQQLLLRVGRATLSDRNMLPCIETDL